MCYISKKGNMSILRYFLCLVEFLKVQEIATCIENLDKYQRKLIYLKEQQP